MYTLQSARWVWSPFCAVTCLDERVLVGSRKFEELEWRYQREREREAKPSGSKKEDNIEGEI